MNFIRSNVGILIVFCIKVKSKKISKFVFKLKQEMMNLFIIRKKDFMIDQTFETKSRESRCLL